jgi:hypothetical protein
MEAKRQRQKLIVIVLLVVLVIVFAYEIPHTLHLFGGSSPSSTSATASTPGALAPAKPRRIPRSLRASNDPFVARTLADGDPQMGGETGGHDPFAQPGVASAASAPAQPVSSPLPKQIVLGTPGAHRHAYHGWIVILASIPTGQGRDSAVHFASSASGNVGSLQILNSSNRRPLRGGYWVVYTGPYNTLAQVSQRADSVHAAGYPDAYIRELIVYR